MSTFTKQTTMTASFDNNSLSVVSISTSTYNKAISLMTRNDETVVLKFNSKADLLVLIEAIIDGALAINWENDYDSSHTYMDDTNSERVTLSNLLEWKKDSASLNSVIEG